MSNNLKEFFNKIKHIKDVYGVSIGHEAPCMSHVGWFVWVGEYSPDTCLKNLSYSDALSFVGFIEKFLQDKQSSSPLNRK